MLTNLKYFVNLNRFKPENLLCNGVIFKTSQKEVIQFSTILKNKSYQNTTMIKLKQWT